MGVTTKDRWKSPAWLFQEKADAVHDLLSGDGLTEDIAIVVEDAATTTVSDVLTLEHKTTGTAAAGFGTGVSLRSENGAGTVEEWASIDLVSTTVTDGSEDGDIVFKAMQGGTVAEVGRFDASADKLHVLGGLEIDGAAQFDGDVTLGDAAADTVIIKGRLATTSVAGAALDLGASYDKGEWAELRPRVTDWTGIGSQFNGLYLRAETTVDKDGGSLRGAEILAVANGADIDDLKGAFIQGYVKGDTAETSTQVVGVHAEISGDAGRANSTTLTRAVIGLFKLLAWKVADYTKFHGLRLLFGDMDGGSRTFGSGIQLLDDPDTSGTSVLTNVIETNLAATNLVKVTATGQGGVTITDAWNTEQAAADLAGVLTIDVGGTPYYANLYTSTPTTV